MIGFPLLIIPFAIYNIVALIMRDVDWGATPYTFPLKSGVQWGPTLGDAFIVFSLLMLMFEVIKSTRHGRSLVEHFLVLLLACGAAAEFAMVKEVGNSIFMLFVAICFVDLFAGFAAALRRARRAVVVAPEPVVMTPAPAVRAEPATRLDPVARAEPAAIEPRPDPFVKVTPAEKIP